MKSFFKKMLGVFKKAWFLSFLVVAVLSLLVWFLIPWPNWALFLTIIGLVFIWGIFNIIMQKRSDKHVQEAAERKKELATGELPNPKLVKATLENLVVRFTKAVNIVNSGSFAKSFFRRTNYALPWYLVMGSSGAGKSTLLKNADLEIYEEYNNETNVSHGDVDPLCSWVFSKDAVFVDVDGKIFEDNRPKSLPSQVWHQLILLFRKHRSKKPLSGIILTLDVKALLLSTDKQRQFQAFQFRQRLKELNSVLGVNCPVYCVFNKFDTVAGFNDYFDGIDSNQRGEKWGITFEYDEEDSMSNFINEFDRVLNLLKEKLIEKLQSNEWDQFRSGLINGFLLQMGFLRNILRDFVKNIFQKNGYYDQTFLRGTYFLSSCRDGVPVDYISRIINPELGLDHQPLPAMLSRNTSTFARNLLSHLIPEEKNMITLSDYARKKLDIRKAFTYAVAAIIVVSGVILWWQSHSRGVENFAQVDDLIAQIKSTSEKPQYQGSLNNRMPILNALSQIRFDLNPKLHSFTSSWGLFEGGVVIQQLDTVYLGQLRTYLLPYLKQMLETNIKNNDSKSQYQLFNDLQSYLMICMPKYSVPGYVENWLQSYWEKAYPYDQLYRNSLYSNLVSLLQLNTESSSLNVPLVRKARQQLRTVSLSQLSFYNLVTNVGYELDTNIKMEMMLNAQFDQVFGTSAEKFDIPKLFSEYGYTHLFQPNIKPAIDNLSQAWWVLGVYKPKFLPPAQKEQIKNGMVSLYMDAFIDKWRTALSHLKVVKFDSISQADSVLQTLGGDDSPIKKILEIVYLNTNLEPMGKLLFIPKADIAETGVLGNVTKAQQAFAPLNDIIAPSKLMAELDKSKLVDAAEKATKTKKATPYDNLQKSFNQLYLYVHQLSQQNDGGQSAYAFALKSLTSQSNSPLATLDNMALGFPEPLKRWVQSIVGNVWGAILNDAGGYLGVAWAQQIYPKYQAMIANKYPVNENAKSELDLNDFAEFFGPKGVMDSFFEKNLAPFVDQTDAKWKWKKIEGHTIGLPDSVLKIFQRSEEIKDAFFAGDSKTPKVSFQVSPTSLDGTSQELDITLNGQVVKYQHGPIQKLSMEWPKPTTYPMASVCFVSINGQQVAKTMTGAWAWMKLLHSLKVKQGLSQTQIKVTAQFGGHRATFNIQTQGLVNPFYPNILAGFKLPKSIQ